MRSIPLAGRVIAALVLACSMAEAQYDHGLRRVQAPAGEMPAPPPPNPAAEPAPTGTGLSGASAAENPEGGDEPTEAEEAEEAAEEPEEKDETKLLMGALGLEDSPVKIYGWIQNSYTGNTNGKPANGENFGVFPNHLANSWMGNQYYLIVEKPLEQNDEVNFGFRVDNLFGHDWQFNYMQGFFNDAFGLNQFSGYDIAQFYAEVHLPDPTEMTKGMDIRGGRFYTLAGYEVVPATGRPLLSVPYMFNYGQPFTHFGMMSTWHITDKINVHNCLINGWDRWINERYKWNYMGGFTWTFNEDKTSLTFVGIVGPNQYPSFLPADQQIYPTGYVNIPSLAGRRNFGYGDNERTLFTTVLSHKWTDKLTQVIESDQAHEQKIPGLGANPVGSNGTPQSAEWYSFGNWFLYQFNDKLTGVWRSEVFRDDDGARTGVADTFYEMTLGTVYKPCPSLWIRPEARYDWAQFKSPYNDGTRGSQFTLAFDVILLY